MAKKKAKKRAVKRTFHAAKIQGRYRYNLKELRELMLSGLTEKQQEAYIVGTIAKTIVAGVKKSKTGRVTCSYNYFIFYAGEMIAVWQDPSLLSTPYTIEAFINDMLNNMRNSFALRDMNAPSESGGIGVFRINLIAEKTKLK